MTRKLTIEECYRVAKEKGGLCLEVEYKNKETNMRWMCCTCGYIWKANFGNIKNGGKWCPKCAGCLKHTIDDCMFIAKCRGGLCLEKEYLNNNVKMRWFCGRCNCEWENSFSNIKNNNEWCPNCYGSKRYTIDECQAYAERKGGKCLSEEYLNNHSKLKWACACGHVWCACFNSILRGTWCPKCKNNSRKKDLDYYKQIGLSIGLNLVYSGPIITKEKYLWVCENGHEIYARVDGIKKLSKCFHCYPNRHTIDDCKVLAKNNGGLCLSSGCNPGHEPYLWKCGECDNIWGASFYNVKAGSWCPKCAAGKTQKQLAKTLQGILKEEPQLNVRSLSFLVNPETNRNLEIDIWFPSLKLAIEYDGQLHFYPVGFFGGEDNLEKTTNRDKIKDILISQNPDKIKTFIRFAYFDDLSEPAVRAKLEEFSVL